MNKRFHTVTPELVGFSTKAYRYDYNWRRRSQGHVAGVDEAGRGAIAGPVVAAAVILDTQIAGVYDSKCLSSNLREKVYAEIMKQARGIGIGVEDVTSLCNIHWATLRAMRSAIRDLGVKPSQILIDGVWTTASTLPQKSVVRGDGKSLVIGAASIVAKVTRDRIMTTFADEFPVYGFDRHKGYATVEHKKAISRCGLCSIHRRSFPAVQALVSAD